MTEAWKLWEGQVVNQEFHLRQYLGGSDDQAVFLTDFGEQEPQRAAIKLIAADPENAELQLSGWELAAKLSHPHLIRLFQMGRCQLANTGLLYVVMEYAEEALSQILPHRPLTPAESRDMLAHVLDVLAYLHSKGFVHGHIKPSNIMALDDQLKVSSDRLSRVGESRGGLGKPSVYDPPETASAGISPAADVWSLGMTLVESLTQRLPVGKETEQRDPAVPETLGPPFLDIARHCLLRAPERRWTVAEIKARLQPISPARREQISAKPRKQFVKWGHIVPIAVALGIVAMLAAPRLLKRRPETQPAPSSVLEQPGPNTPARGPVRSAVANQVIPDVPRRARDTIRGTVRVAVRVVVDPSGSVVGAKVDSPGPSKYFADLALQAAHRWKFRPAKVDGQTVSSEWILTFRFERAATTVLTVQAAP